MKGRLRRREGWMDEKKVAEEGRLEVWGEGCEGVKFWRMKKRLWRGEGLEGLAGGCGGGKVGGMWGRLRRNEVLEDEDRLRRRKGWRDVGEIAEE